MGMDEKELYAWSCSMKSCANHEFFAGDVARTGWKPVSQGRALD